MLRNSPACESWSLMDVERFAAALAMNATVIRLTLSYRWQPPGSLADDRFAFLIQNCTLEYLKLDGSGGPLTLKCLRGSLENLD